MVSADSDTWFVNQKDEDEGREATMGKSDSNILGDLIVSDLPPAFYTCLVEF